MKTRPFLPRPLNRGGWECPCRDTRGSAAELRPVRNFADGTARAGDRLVENYTCDQNRDRWQRIVGLDGSGEWHYLGRPDYRTWSERNYMEGAR